MTGNARPALAANAKLDLAVLPLADTRRTDEHNQCAARFEVLFEPWLLRLACGKAVAVEECVETRLVEPRRSVAAAAASARE